jgi:hypothetical protein
VAVIFVAYFDSEDNPVNIRLTGHDPSPSRTHAFDFHTDFPTNPDLATFQVMAFDMRGTTPPNPDMLISCATTVTPTIYIFASHESYPLTEPEFDDMLATDSSRNRVFTLFEALYHPWE